MNIAITFAGFGGQGVMMAGKLLAYCAMKEGWEVSWLPSYGPEMRGGTANCIVIISDKPIGSPLVTHPQSAVVMNNPSLERFGLMVKPGGDIIINSSLINIPLQRGDIIKYEIPANQIAMDTGTGKAANMVMLGAYVGTNDFIQVDVLKELIREEFQAKPKFIDVNINAMLRGFEYVKNLRNKKHEAR